VRIEQPFSEVNDKARQSQDRIKAAEADRDFERLVEGVDIENSVYFANNIGMIRLVES
jgi:hypothetical protein